jgi:hypothetical protein
MGGLLLPPEDGVGHHSADVGLPRGEERRRVPWLLLPPDRDVSDDPANVGHPRREERRRVARLLLPRLEEGRHWGEDVRSLDTSPGERERVARLLLSTEHEVGDRRTLPDDDAL